jgi:cysteinyl-tRNA synthetase
MNLRLHNTRTHATEAFVPQDPNRVTMYLCGPTVYNHVHIGNARGPVVFGLLVRLLRHLYGREHVVYARNITDVDDKINDAAAELGVPIDVITNRYAAAYFEDIGKLGGDDPDVIPYATQHIVPIIAMCERLIADGHAYAAADHVLFDVGSYADYGKLSGRSTEEMIAGARVEVAPYKKNPADFVLWKPSTPELPGWDSPWGRGRPGWHIECSAMCEAHLGETIDIHAGGNDLMFPHHENEVAQSTCAHGGKVFARWWLHNGMLTFGGRKMSKSLGNTLVLHELLEKYPAELLRYMLMKAHYRQPLDWSDATLAQAQATLDGWYGVLRDLADVSVDANAVAEADAELVAALCDDLNTPEAFALVAARAAQARKAETPQDKRAAKTALLRAAAFLGLLQLDPEVWFKGAAGDAAVDPAWIEAQLAERAQARARRDFAAADGIRNRLLDKGVIIEDGPQGARWKLAPKTQDKPDECPA